MVHSVSRDNKISPPLVPGRSTFRRPGEYVFRRDIKRDDPEVAAEQVALGVFESGADHFTHVADSDAHFGEELEPHRLAQARSNLDDALKHYDKIHKPQP